MGALLLALPLALVPVLPAAAADWGISKQEVSTGPYQPGENVQWIVTVSCSDPNAAPCTPTTITDPLPEGLELVGATIQSQAGATNGQVVADTETDTVTYTADSVNNGGQVQILITAQVDPDLPYSANGVTITNTATVVSDNAAQQQASDDIAPVVPLALGSETTKSIDPPGALAAPGTPATMSLGSTNTSNDPVDTLVIQDPVDPTAVPNPFTYLEYAGTGDITLPPNATEVTEEYWDGSAWLPLDDSVDPADVQGVRYTFSGDIQPGAIATVPVNVVQSEAVEELTDPTTVTNDVSSYVTHPEGESEPTTADDTYVITPPNNAVTASKSFDPDQVSAGDPTTVTLGATNAGTPVDSLTITEPAPGTPSPFEGDDALTFTGFGPSGDGTGVTWPPAATAATVTFTCAENPDPVSVDASAPNTLPNPPDGCTVVGFSVEFTGDIVTGAQASIPFTADTDPDQEADDVTHPNTVEATVPSADPSTATDELLTLVDRLATETSKLISPSEFPAVPGQDVIVQLPSQILPFGPEGSTTNADQVIVQDPTDPENPSDFWDHFTASSVRSTDVPADSTLTINYWNGSEWVPAPDCGNPIPGPATVSCDLPPDAQGVQFVYDSTGDGFPPGTQFQPNFTAEFQGPPNFDEPLTNCGASSASSGTVPATPPAEGCATVDPFPVDPGEGDLIEKDFLGEQPPSVLARSDDQVTAQITWSTGGFSGVDPMVISDVADPETTPLASSFYDAFDLVRIEAVDASLDPLVQYDAITGVELYDGTSWNQATNATCTEATPCIGGMPAVPLTGPEQESTVSVRLVYTESPVRGTGDPLAPQPGDGVARSTLADGRHLNLTFEVRDYKRSDGTPALGSTNGTMYNTGDPGLVNDTARATGTLDGEEYTDVDGADVLIIDQPLNVTVAKDWTGGPISVPPAETPAEFYPTTHAVVTGTNASAAKVDQLRIVEPGIPTSGDVQTADGTPPFDVFTLRAIDVTPPAGTETTTVTLAYDDDTTADFTEAEAEALGTGDLADVVGVVVQFDGLVEAGASGVLDLTLQLRELDRYTGAPVTVASDSPVPNGAVATIDDVGGTSGDVRLAYDDATMELQDAAIALEVGKSFDPVQIVEPSTGPVTMTLTGQPLGPSRTVEMVLVDDDPQFWNQYDFAGFDGATLTAPIQQVQVDAFVGGTFTAGPDGVEVAGGDWVLGEPSDTFDLPDDVDPGEVQGLRFTFSRTDGSIWENPATPTQEVPISVERREDLRTGGPVLPDLAANPPAPGETAPGVASNTVQGSVTGADLVVDPESGELVPISSTDDAAEQIVYVHATNGVLVAKDFAGVVSGGTQTPAAVFPMNIAVTNTGDRPIFDLVVADVPMPADAQGAQLRLADVAEPFSYALAPPSEPVNGDPLPTDPAQVTVEQTGDLDGLVFSFPEGTVLEVGQRYTITVQVQFRVGLPAETVVLNTAGATGDRPWDVCQNGTVDEPVDVPVNEETGACEADADVTPIPGAVIAQSKFVKATNDDELDVIVDPDPLAPDVPGGCVPDADGFYVYPCTPVIAPGHLETWRIRVDNVGNLPLEKVVIYDRLPAIGDTGSVGTSPRGSAWTPILSNTPPPALVNAPPGSTTSIHYTTSDTYCMDDLQRPQEEPVCPTDDAEAGWVELPDDAGPELALTIKALKFVIELPEGDLFQPGEFIAMEGSTFTPPVAPEAGDRSIAWNSAAASAVVVTTGGGRLDLLPTEGTKVGVATATGPLAVNKVVTGEGAANAPDSFALNVQCTSAVGTPVELVLAPIPITVVPGTPTVVPNLPYGAECTITEDGTNGETELIVGTVTIDSEDPENPATITAVNRYDLSSIEISKEVVTDAVDQDGNPVPFGPFAVDVECTFLGEDVYAEGYDADNPMTDIPIEDGETIELTGLPVGAVCTVTESGTGNASSVTITVDQGLPGHPVTTDGPTTDVTLTPDVLGQSTNDVTLTNTYDVGGIGLQKVVDGEGGPAYGTGPFTISVVCTYDDDGDGPLAPRTVYDSEVVLGGAGPLTAQIANLPTGAVCDIEEVDDMGATDSVVVPETVTVGSGDVANVVITNTFDIGTIQVDKELDGLGALYGPGPFEVTLACTYGEDAEGQPVEILVPGGAVRTFVPGQPAVYEDLPVGSECTVEETDDFGATEVEMSVDGGEPVDGTSVLVVVPPAAEDGSPTTVTVTVTNTFLTAPLLVEKVVDGDAAGFAPPMPEIPPLPELPDEPPTPEELATLIDELEAFYVAFPLDDIPYRASLSCTFQGAEIPIAGGPVRPFGPDLPGVYFGLPVGSVCTVTETETGSATEVTLEPNPVQIEERTIPGPVQVVTVTNTYDAGAIEVTKVVDGDGAVFGAGPFIVSLACTFLGEPIEIPGGAERTISGGEVAVFDGLPVGAECVVTETATGGASSTTVSASVEGGEPGAATIGADPAQVTVTNTFDAGQVVVTKELAGSGASQHRGDEFVVTLACTWAVDGVETDVVIPGGAERTLSADDDWTAVYALVPQGATCTVSETDAGDAEAVTLTVAGGAGVTVDPDDETPTSEEFTVPTGDAAEVDLSVTNAFRATGGGSLPPTGASVGAAAVLAVLLVGTGALMADARRRGTRATGRV